MIQIIPLIKIKPSQNTVFCFVWKHISQFCLDSVPQKQNLWILWVWVSWILRYHGNFRVCQEDLNGLLSIEFFIFLFKHLFNSFFHLVRSIQSSWFQLGKKDAESFETSYETESGIAMELFNYEWKVIGWELQIEAFNQMN